MGALIETIMTDDQSTDVEKFMKFYDLIKANFDDFVSDFKQLDEKTKRKICDLLDSDHDELTNDADELKTVLLVYVYFQEDKREEFVRIMADEIDRKIRHREQQE